MKTAETYAIEIINDSRMYQGQVSSIIKNLANKMKKGTYDEDLAIVLWAYAAESWLYFTRETPWKRFPSSLKKEIAKHLAEYYADHVRSAAAS